MAPKRRTRSTATAAAASKKAKVDTQTDTDAAQAVSSATAPSHPAASAANPKATAFSPVPKPNTVDASMIPVDEGCSLQGSHLVYIDADGVIYDAALNQTNSGQNNNKFYRIQLLHNAKTANYMTWTRWGRVGDRGQHALLGDGTLDSALSNFEKKFKDKSKLKWQDRFDPPKPKSYVFLEKDYEPDSDQDDNATPADPKTTAQSERPVDHVEPTSKLVQPLQDLMKLIFNQQFMSNAMTAMNYNANKMPLGKLSKRTLEQAFQTLKDLSAHIIDGVPGTSHQDVENLSNLYFSLIPHDFGRNRAPIISTEQLLRNETELLESLSDMKLADEIMKSAKKGASDGERESLHHYDRQFNSLGMTEMTPLKHSTKEFKMLAAYLKESKGATHAMSYEIEEIFRIERNGEEERFGSSDYAKLTKKNRRLLWHGSRATNFGGILSQGLRIAPPEAPVNGYMFGKGVYLADMSSKSAGYCCPHNSGGSALLLLCDAELGDPMLELTNAEYNAGDLAKKNGSLTTWGKGRTGPSKWKDASCVHKTLKGVKMPDTAHTPGDTNVDGAYLLYNEYIVYDVRQIRLRYLFRVKM